VQREHLTKVLCQYGALRHGHVREVVVESSRPTLLSRIIRLRLEYEGDAPYAPHSVIFKTGLPERLSDSWTGGRQEVAFYTLVAAAMSECLVPRCFDAHWDSDTNASHLLLEDLTDTHVVAKTWPLPPTTEQCKQILRTLACFHAEWWDHPRLGVSVGAWLDSDVINQLMQRFTGSFRNFADRLGDRL
jgi:Ecdysteroid kinase-like family